MIDTEKQDTTISCLLHKGGISAEHSYVHCLHVVELQSQTIKSTAEKYIIIETLLVIYDFIFIPVLVSIELLVSHYSKLP
jgi:hypothetical protein